MTLTQLGRRPLRILGLLLGGALFWAHAGSSTLVRAQDVRVRNVEVLRQGKRVIVQYDLHGDREATYNVDLRLSRNGGATFDYIPTATSGAVGSGISPGRGKEIDWAVLQDFPDGIEGQNFQFKVLARREGPVRSQRQSANRSEEPSQTVGDEEDRFKLKVGIGLSYDARETIEVQYYDGYQASLAFAFPRASLEIRANYRNSTGTFRQDRTFDLDLLYSGGVYYVGAGVGMYGPKDGFFGFNENKYNLSGIGGIGFSIGWIYPYIEYRIPFSRGNRDDVLSGGILYTF